VAFDHIDLMLDVPAILKRLPDDLRDLAHRLQRKKLAEVARDLNTPLSSLQRRRDRLRSYLSDLQNDFFS
jgi:capsid portal protein